jgi:hypothetical protein
MTSLLHSLQSAKCPVCNFPHNFSNTTSNSSHGCYSPNSLLIKTLYPCVVSCHILHKCIHSIFHVLIILTIFGEESNQEAAQHALFTRCSLLASCTVKCLTQHPVVWHTLVNRVKDRVLCPYKTVSKYTYFYTSTLTFSGSR